MAVVTEIHCETRLNWLPEKSCGQINRPFLPRSATFNRPPFFNPFRWHHSVGETVWRFEVEGIVVFFAVRIYYPTNSIYQGGSRILAVKYCATTYAKRP